MDYRDCTLDSMVIFESPIHIKDNPPCYGFLFSTESFNKEENIESVIEGYMAYVRGAERWLNEGFNIEEHGDWWEKGEKEFYHYKETEIKTYCQKAYENNPISYTIKIGCRPVFKPEDLEDGIFIIREIQEKEMEGADE